MIVTGLKLRHLTFTGPGLKPASLAFADGLNIVYGASNTGKSFIGKSLDFMLGGSRPLPDITERQGYDSVLLGLILPDDRPVTLYRAAVGGEYLMFDGSHEERPIGVVGKVLGSEHDAKTYDNLSN